MEHAAHVCYHDKVDSLERKGWTRTSVFMRRLVIDAQAVVLYMAVCVLIFVIDLFTQGTAERLASPPYREATIQVIFDDDEYTAETAHAFMCNEWRRFV